MSHALVRSSGVSRHLRASLRIYTPSHYVENEFVVHVFTEPEGAEIVRRELRIALPTDAGAPPFVPSLFDFSGALADASLQNPGRVRVVIDSVWPPNLRYWPLLTVTDNATQRVLVVTAQ